MGSGHMTHLAKQTSKCMLGGCTPCMTCRRLHFLLHGACTEGSHARNASLLLSFIGCRRVASILALTCIDNSCLWTMDSEKTRRISPKVKLSSTRHHL